MKKKIILCSLIFLLTGCTANYNIEITKDTINENVQVQLPKSTTTKAQADTYANIETPISQSSTQQSFYTTSLDEDSNNYYLNYNYNHEISSFSQSYFASRCYQNIDLEETEDMINLSTSNNFMCIHMDDGAFIETVDINITTDLKVLSNNADEVNGNVYTWHINSSNYQNKPINLEMQKTFDISDIEVPSSTIYIFIIFGTIFGIFILILLFVKHKTKKNNKLQCDGGD